MYLELPKKLKVLGDMATNLSVEMLRPISRKYDLAEHDYPKELDLVASMLDGMNDGEGGAGVGADQSKQKSEDNNGWLITKHGPKYILRKRMRRSDKYRTKMRT